MDRADSLGKTASVDTPLEQYSLAIACTAFVARTLTNLYNARPTWLDLAHKRLDEAYHATWHNLK